MKKLFTALFLLSASLNFAQITLEHQYANANVYLTEVASGVWNYYTYANPNLSVYDITHTLIKSITIPSVGGYTTEGISLLSTNLFNTDAYYEYGVYYEKTTYPVSIRFCIYNELGTQLFTLDSADYGSCYNTSAGLKMIVNQTGIYETTYKNGNVYSLGGNFLATAPIVSNGNADYSVMSPYPNPSNNNIHLLYSLPAGTTNGEMIITNLVGQVIKTLDIGNAFNDILFDTKQYEPGEYFYYITCGNYTSPTSKFIINR